MVGHLVAKNGLRPNSFLGVAKMKMTINSPWLIFEVSHHYKPPIRRGDPPLSEIIQNGLAACEQCNIASPSKSRKSKG